MSPEEADAVRHLLTYDPNTAGGLMIAEYVVYDESDRVRDVLEDLDNKRETYKDYHVQYLDARLFPGPQFRNGPLAETCGELRKGGLYNFMLRASSFHVGDVSSRDTRATV